jgi:hypothetical protein
VLGGYCRGSIPGVPQTNAKIKTLNKVPGRISDLRQSRPNHSMATRDDSPDQKTPPRAGRSGSPQPSRSTSRSGRVAIRPTERSVPRGSFGLTSAESLDLPVVTRGGSSDQTLRPARSIRARLRVARPPGRDTWRFARPKLRLAWFARAHLSRAARSPGRYTWRSIRAHLRVPSCTNLKYDFRVSTSSPPSHTTSRFPNLWAP